MSARDGLIEAMARGEFDRRFGSWWDSATAEAKQLFRIQSKRRLEDIEAHAGGCWIVPLIATREMAEAMTEAAENGADEIELYPIMLAASPYAPENGA